MALPSKKQLENGVKKSKTANLGRIKGEIAAELDEGKFSGDAVAVNEMAIEVIDAELVRRRK